MVPKSACIDLPYPEIPVHPEMSSISSPNAAPTEATSASKQRDLSQIKQGSSNDSPEAASTVCPRADEPTSFPEGPQPTPQQAKKIVSIRLHGLWPLPSRLTNIVIVNSRNPHLKIEDPNQRNRDQTDGNRRAAEVSCSPPPLPPPPLSPTHSSFLPPYHQ